MPNASFCASVCPSPDGGSPQAEGKKGPSELPGCKRPWKASPSQMRRIPVRLRRWYFPDFFQHHLRFEKFREKHRWQAGLVEHIQGNPDAVVLA